MSSTRWMRPGRRVGAVAPAAVLVGTAWSGVASAQSVTPSTPLPVSTTTPSLSTTTPSLSTTLPSSLFSLLPSLPTTGSQGGTAAETAFPTSPYPVTYPSDAGQSYGGYASAAPVYATQVSSVPTGGVDTGDGST